MNALDAMSRPLYYRLGEGGEPVPCDLLTWAQSLESGGRVLAQDSVTAAGVDVSTVFLGMDHAFFGGPPVLWETMVFGGEHDQYQRRYTSQDAAWVGHGRACNLVARRLVYFPVTLLREQALWDARNGAREAVRAYLERSQQLWWS